MSHGLRGANKRVSENLTMKCEISKLRLWRVQRYLPRPQASAAKGSAARKIPCHDDLLFSYSQWRSYPTNTESEKRLFENTLNCCGSDTLPRESFR
jgi:hypothetical protein